MIHFYFDFLSPYSYLAFNQVAKWRQDPTHAFHSQSFLLRPVFLPQVVTAFQKEGPGDIPVKRNYMLKDCRKKAAALGLDFTIPKVLPFNTSLPLRLMTLFSGEEQWQLGLELFHLSWGLGADIGDELVLQDLLQKRSLTLEDLSDGMKRARLTLKQNHELAREREIFGLPTFDFWSEHKKEFYWGNDSLSTLLNDLTH